MFASVIGVAMVTVLGSLSALYACRLTLFLSSLAGYSRGCLDKSESSLIMVIAPSLNLPRANGTHIVSQTGVIQVMNLY